MNLAKRSATATAVSAAWLAHRRALLALPVAVALLLVAPGLAYATFTARTTAALSVGTYKVPAPASVAGTLQCASFQGRKGASISFTSFAAVARATGYTATLTSPDASQTVSDIAVGDTSLGLTLLSKGSGKGIYTFTLSARVGPWTGEQLQQTVTC